MVGEPSECGLMQQDRRTMNIEKQSIIEPLPDDTILLENERVWRLKLPIEYKEFLKKFNGGIPKEKTFFYHNHGYGIVRFLGIVKDYKSSELGWYDINVVDSHVGERLSDNMGYGIDVLPIAELFAGDLLCLDFRGNTENPIVSIWFHEESGEFDPCLEKVADDFESFLEMLH